RHPECSPSCDFAASARDPRGSPCPPPRLSAGFTAACVPACRSDAHCGTPRRCCADDCGGATCRATRPATRGVPLKPQSELAVSLQPGGGGATGGGATWVDVRWTSRFNVSAQPVVFVLQGRWNHGIHPSEVAASPWETVSMVTSSRVRVSGLRPARWYQLRVAAVNAQGTRGFTAPSRHFTLPQDPSPPPPPSSLRLSHMTFAGGKGGPPEPPRGGMAVGAGGGVRVRVSWQPPVDPDVPVRYYRVSITTTATTATARREGNRRRRRVDTPHPWLDVSGLAPGSRCRVSVQAVSVHRALCLRSLHARLYFTTPALTATTTNITTTTTTATTTTAAAAAVAETAEEAALSSEGSIPARDVGGLVGGSPPTSPGSVWGEGPTVHGVRVGAPFYRERQLRAKVEWETDVNAVQGAAGAASTSPRFLVRWTSESCAGGVPQHSHLVLTQERWLLLNWLHLGCSYRVNVSPSSPSAVAGGDGPPSSSAVAGGDGGPHVSTATASFSTPPCLETGRLRPSGLKVTAATLAPSRQRTRPRARGSGTSPPPSRSTEPT
uniref:Anosmin-1-like n=1 Tax=Petromyzon marinus TaxID=7757 RepID=A0AAJ7SJP3_PETMA